MTQYLAFDIGGTNLKYALINKEGQIIEKGSTPSKTENLDVFMESMYKIADKYEGKFEGIAVCAPGKIDTQKKIIHFGGALPFLDGLNLQETLGKKYGVPVGAENDGKAAALCEQWLGELHEVKTGAVMTLGTGVGGGILVDNRVLHGATFQAGELSWMMLDAGLGTKNIVSYAGYSCSAVNMIKKINLALGNTANLEDGEAVFEAINKGNLRAKTIFKRYCRNVAIMILNIQTVINGEKIVIGGGISAQPVLIEEIRKQFQNILKNNPMLGNQVTAPKIVAAKFKNDTNLYGALYALLLELNSQEAR